MQTGLHWAVKKSYTDIAGLLLLNGTNVDAQDFSGKTPLHIAASLNKRQQIKFLMKLNANPEIKTKNGKCPEDMTFDKVLKHILHNGKLVKNYI